MGGVLTFRPVFSETLDRVRSRMNQDANAGLSPIDAAYLDTTPGGFFYDLTQAPALEIARMWDALNEMIAASFLEFSWGVYLDSHGVTIGVQRKDSTIGTGMVQLTGTPDTILGTGTEVATEQVSPDIPAVSFQTLAGGIIPSGGVLSLPVQATVRGSVGNVPAGSITVLLSPVDGVASLTNIDPITGGANVETDEEYRRRLILAYTGAHGAGTLADYMEWALAYPNVGFATIDPLWNGPGTVRVIVTDEANNPVSQQVIDGLQAVLDPYSEQTISTGTNTFPAATVQVVTTAGFLPSGDAMIGGTKFSYTGLTSNSFTGVSGGTGSYPAGTAVTQAGLGHGLAPIGAIVTVATPALVNIVSAATIVPVTGYTLDGAGGTIALADDITNAVHDYIDGLRPGEDVVLNAVRARIMDVQGVYDVTGVTINTVAANFTIGSLEVAQPGLVTLS